MGTDNNYQVATPLIAISVLTLKTHIDTIKQYAKISYLMMPSARTPIFRI